MVKKLFFTFVLLWNGPLWADEAAKSPAPASPQVAMNEMTGTVESVSSDPKTLRLTVDGGYNVEFTYDSQTVAHNGGHDITVPDLSYGDKVVVRYVGMDLVAREVERTAKAAAPALPNPESPAVTDPTGAAPVPSQPQSPPQQ